ncbi:hypothetical protein BHMPCIPO_01865 [Ensifer sesbaniae]|nr:hypothetical protein [Ensifer sesbaniae]
MGQGRTFGPVPLPLAGMGDQTMSIETACTVLFDGTRTSPARRFTSSSRIFLAPQCGFSFLQETIIASTAPGNWLA